MTRIIAGAARGRRLSVPPGTRTRPTSDRAREGLFATITARHGPLDRTAFLDLYAGSGAVGLEALSRGAAPVLFVESDPAAARVIRANMTAVGLPGAELVTGQVATVLRRGPGRVSRGGAPGGGVPAGGVPAGGVPGGGLPGGGVPAGGDPAGRVLGDAIPDGRVPDGGPAFGVVVADPPYATGDEEVTAMLTALQGGWLAPGALVVVERATRSGPVAWPEGYASDRSRRYGEATFWYGLAAGI